MIFGLIILRWNVGVQIFQCIGEKAVTFFGELEQVDEKLHKLPYDLQSATKTLPFMQSSLLWQGAKGILSLMETIGQDASLYDLIETRFGGDMAKYLGKGLERVAHVIYQE